MINYNPDHSSYPVINEMKILILFYNVHCISVKYKHQVICK